jgi:hypothetical protein
MKAYGGVDAYIDILLSCALVGGEWSASHPGHFIPEKRASVTHWIGGWVDPRTGLDNAEKKILSLMGLELQLLNRPVRCQLLYRQSHPGFKHHK